MKVSVPTNGSVMILKASAENGAVSLVGRVTSRPALGVLAVHRGDVQRRGQVVHHRVQQRLHALVLEGRAAEDGEDLPGDAALAEAQRSAPPRWAPSRRGSAASRASSCSAQASIRCTRAAFAASASSAGMSTTSKRLPCSESSKTSAFILSRSITPPVLVLGAQRSLHRHRVGVELLPDAAHRHLEVRAQRGPSC